MIGRSVAEMKVIMDPVEMIAWFDIPGTPRPIRFRHRGNIIKVESLKVMLPDGGESTRDVVLHPGAAAVVPISGNGELYMVRQYRKPIEMETLEIIYGMLE